MTVNRREPTRLGGRRARRNPGARRGTLFRTDDRLTVNPPKATNGWRTVPASPAVLPALRERRQQQAADQFAPGPSWIATPHVFTSEAGTPLELRSVSRWFVSLAEATGVGGSLHSLRHTALTTMANAGVPSSVVSRLAGHESVSTTIDLYGHLSDDAARDAMLRGAAALACRSSLRVMRCNRRGRDPTGTPVAHSVAHPGEARERPRPERNPL